MKLLLHALNEASSSLVVGYHCGRDIGRSGFSLEFVGSGEGFSALGPGIYFSTSKEIAERYCKYGRDKHDKAYLYRVEIDGSGLWNNTTGKPAHLREGLELLVASFGLQNPHRGVDTMRHGPGLVGAVFKHLGPKAGRAALIKAGVTGSIQLLEGQSEIAVYDLSILSHIHPTTISLPPQAPMDDYEDWDWEAEADALGN